MGFNATYFGKLGLFKIAEIICLVIAFATYESQLPNVSISSRTSLLNYYLAIMMVTCALFAIWFLINCFGLIRKSNVLGVSLLHVTLGCMIFAPSCILVHRVAAFPQFYNASLKTSVAFGIISSVFIYIDALFHHVIAASESSGTA